MKEKLHYMFFSMTHPFDGFYEIRFRDKGSVLLASIVLAIYGIMKCARAQYTGFILNLNDMSELNSISIFMSSVVLVILFCISNWSVTTLFGGKGNMQGIYTIMCYCLIPLIVSDLLVTVLSNFIILDEAMLLYMLEGIGIVWFVFLVVSGLCVAHEYGLFQNLASIFVTFIAAVLIVFLVVLFLTLEEKMFSFATDIVREIIRTR
ncbi:MAG: YIP1 family protein [Butyrivibrio sp.]|nr:YIP1 family protein [Butyrivibrio sp.]